MLVGNHLNNNKPSIFDHVKYHLFLSYFKLYSHHKLSIHDRITNLAVFIPVCYLLCVKIKALFNDTPV